MRQHETDPSKRIAQHKLAKEVLRIVHGAEVAEQAEREHRNMFQSRTKPHASAQPHRAAVNTNASSADSSATSSDPVSDASILATKSSTFQNLAPCSTLPASLVYNTSICTILFHAKVVRSKSESRRLFVTGGAYIGALPSSSSSATDNQIEFFQCKDSHDVNTADHIIDGDLLVLRVGKARIRVVKIIPDEDFERRGLDAPGWKEWKRAAAAVAETGAV